MTQTATPPQTSTQPTYELTKADRDRQAAIAYAWQAYNGELDPPLQKMPDGTDPNVRTNRMQQIVDRGVDFLFGKELDIAVEKNGPQAAKDFLDLTWGRTEKRMPMLQELAMNGAMAGAAFLRIMPSSDKPGRAKSYRLVVVDPAIVSMETAPQDCDTVLTYCIQYSQQEKDPGSDKPRTVYYREEITRIDPDGNAERGQPDDDDTWQIQHWTALSQKGAEPKIGDWTPAGPPILWNYPFPPIFHCKNLPLPNSPWGKPDLTPDLIGVNKSLNLTLSDINLNENLIANALMYATGAGESVLERKPGYIVALPNTDSKISAVAVPSDTPHALAFAADLRSDLDEQSGVPGVATGRIAVMPRGNLSGIAIELLHSPLTKKTDKKRCTYGKLILDVSQALLVLNGMSGDIKLTLAWQNPLPHDDLPSVQSGISKRELGISDTTIQRELGYDPDEEWDLSQAEDERKMSAAVERQAMLPAQIPGAPLLPGQPPPAKPGPALAGGPQP